MVNAVQNLLLVKYLFHQIKHPILYIVLEMISMIHFALLFILSSTHILEQSISDAAQPCMRCKLQVTWIWSRSLQSWWVEHSLMCCYSFLLQLNTSSSVIRLYMVPVCKSIRILCGSDMNDLTSLFVDDCSIYVLESRKRFEKLRHR